MIHEHDSATKPILLQLLFETVLTFGNSLANEEMNKSISFLKKLGRQVKQVAIYLLRVEQWQINLLKMKPGFVMVTSRDLTLR